MSPSSGPGRVLTKALVTALVFGGWTLFVWVGRLRNLLAEPGSVFDASRWSLVGSVAFSVLGAVVVIAGLLAVADRGLASVGRSILGPAVVGLAALTIGVWVLRAVDIAIGDHSIGFIAVHLVLAAVSIGLAVAAVTGIRRAGASAETGDGRLPSKRWVSL